MESAEQGHAIELKLRDGRPEYVSTRIDAPCEGTPWSTAWSEHARHVPFEFADDVLTVRSRQRTRLVGGEIGLKTVALRAQLEHGYRMRGYVALRARVLRLDGRSHLCESDWITFAGVAAG